MLTKTILAVGVFVLVFGEAKAADKFVPPAVVPVVEADPVVKDPFSGLFVEGALGVSAAVADVGKVTLGDDGFNGHLAVGFDKRVAPRLVLGAQGRIGVADVGDISSDTLEYSALARIGIVPLGGWMAYALGGYTWADDYDGWKVGGGVDLALDERLYTGVEYTALIVDETGFQGAEHAVKAKLGYRF